MASFNIHTQEFILKISDFTLSTKVIATLKKRADIGKPVNILLGSHNIAYANIIGDDSTETEEKFLALTSQIKAISPKSLLMIEAEGGVIQKIRIPLAPVLFPSSLAFKLFYEKLRTYLYSRIQDDLIELLRDEIYIFFRMSETMKAHIDIKALIESHLSEPDPNKPAGENEKAILITSTLIEINYEVMSRNIKKYGADVILAPVADFYDGNVGLIQSRSFGSDPHLISKFCIAALKGIKNSGLKNCLRHFVGQGQARDVNNRVNDPNQVILNYHGSMEDLMATEGLVFKLIFEEYTDVDYMMLANITLSNITEDLPIKPLLLSPKILNMLFETTKVPKSTTIITMDVFNMPITKHLKDKHDKILIVKEIAEGLYKDLNRNSMILIHHSIEDFEKLGGFEALDKITPYSPQFEAPQ